jgi:hypothetical protein
LADRRTNPADLRAAALWRSQVENQRQDQEAERRAEAENQARLAARLDIPRADARDAGLRSPGEVARDIYRATTHGPQIPRPSMLQSSTPFIGPLWSYAADLQRAPRIRRPNLAESFIPVVGPLWDATADLQNRNYAGAAFNTGMAALDVLPIGTAVKGARAAKKGLRLISESGLTAHQARRMMLKAGMVKPGQHVHHPFQLNGASRYEKNWRNEFPLLKPTDVEPHKRIHGRSRTSGKPRFGPIRRYWYGTPDWMKEVPFGLAGYAADAWENLTDPFGAKTPLPPTAPPASPPIVRRRDGA